MPLDSKIGGGESVIGLYGTVEDVGVQGGAVRDDEVEGQAVGVVIEYCSLIFVGELREELREAL